jgi:hypothetical protein
VIVASVVNLHRSATEATSTAPKPSRESNLRIDALAAYHDLAIGVLGVVGAGFAGFGADIACDCRFIFFHHEIGGGPDG